MERQRWRETRLIEISGRETGKVREIEEQETNIKDLSDKQSRETDRQTEAEGDRQRPTPQETETEERD